MAEAQTQSVGRHSVTIAPRQTVGPPTPYTLLLAESIPSLDGLTAIDIGTGSGLLAIVAAKQGASLVYVLDSNPNAVAAALENANLNGVRDRLRELPVGDSIIPLPSGETVDVAISNPAQLPLPQEAEALNPYYSGPDGRNMIDAVIKASAARLSPRGRLLMVHNSVTNFPKSLDLMRSLGLSTRILGERSLELRPVFDRNWLDEIGGVSAGLYSVENGRAYETIYAVEARAG